jgi:hypothetical protein
MQLDPETIGAAIGGALVSGLTTARVFGKKLRTFIAEEVGKALAADSSRVLEELKRELPGQVRAAVADAQAQLQQRVARVEGAVDTLLKLLKLRAPEDSTSSTDKAA